MPQSLRWGLIWLSAWMILGGSQAQTSDAAQQAEKAGEAMRAGHFEEAIRIYKGLSSTYPGDPALHLSLATALHSAGYYPEAMRQLELIRAHEKQNPKFWFLLGMTELKAGHAAEAVESLNRTLELEPDHDEARLELASTLLEMRRFTAAEKQYRSLARKLATSPQVWQGLVLTQAGLSSEAFDALKKTAPHSSYLYGLAAVAASESGDTANAVALYTKALAASPAAEWMGRELTALQSGGSPARCSGNSYDCLFFNGEMQKLAGEVSRLRTPEALYWTTRVYAQLAKQSMETLTALPPSVEQHEVMARLYAQNGRKTEAIQELREAAKLSPENLPVAGELAEALWADRQYDESLVLLRRLVEASPHRADWQFELGDALFNTGRPDEAVSHLKKAVEISPEFLPAHAKLGEALLRTGDAANAVPHLERAQSIDQDGSIHFQLAAAYRKTGNVDAASKAIERQKELANAAREKMARSPWKQ